MFGLIKHWKKFLLAAVVLLLVLIFLTGKGGALTGTISAFLQEGSPVPNTGKQENPRPKVGIEQKISIALFFKEDRFYLDEFDCSSQAKKIDRNLLERAVKILRERHVGSSLVVECQKSEKTPYLEFERGIAVLEEKGIAVIRPKDSKGSAEK